MWTEFLMILKKCKFSESIFYFFLLTQQYYFIVMLRWDLATSCHGMVWILPGKIKRGKFVFFFLFIRHALKEWVFHQLLDAMLIKWSMFIVFSKFLYPIVSALCHINYGLKYGKISYHTRFLNFPYISFNFCFIFWSYIKCIQIYNFCFFHVNQNLLSLCSFPLYLQ